MNEEHNHPHPHDHDHSDHPHPHPHPAATDHNPYKVMVLTLFSIVVLVAALTGLLYLL